MAAAKFIHIRGEDRFSCENIATWEVIRDLDQDDPGWLVKIETFTGSAYNRFVSETQGDFARLTDEKGQRLYDFSYMTQP